MEQKTFECIITNAQVSNREGIEVVINDNICEHITREGERFTNNKFELSFTQFKKLIEKDNLRVKLLAADIAPKKYVYAAAFVTAVVADGKVTIQPIEVSAGDVIPDTDGLTAENDMIIHRIVKYEPSNASDRNEMLQLAKGMYLQSVSTLSQTVIKPLF